MEALKKYGLILLVALAALAIVWGYLKPAKIVETSKVTTEMKSTVEKMRQLQSTVSKLKTEKTSIEKKLAQAVSETKDVDILIEYYPDGKIKSKKIIDKSKKDTKTETASTATSTATTATTAKKDETEIEKEKKEAKTTEENKKTTENNIFEIMLGAETALMQPVTAVAGNISLKYGGMLAQVAYGKYYNNPFNFEKFTKPDGDYWRAGVALTVIKF